MMKVKFKLIFLLVGLTAILSSCRTSAPRLDYQALARASILLGVDINLEDNHKLYLEAADWIGTPYRGGGDSKEELTVQAWSIKYTGKFIASKCRETRKN